MARARALLESAPETDELPTGSAWPVIPIVGLGVHMCSTSYACLSNAAYIIVLIYVS